MTRTHTTSVVPATYSELFSHYYPYVLGLVRKFRIEEADVEDVAMTILTKFYEKDVLSDFDAERLSASGKPIQFMSFLSGFVAAYIQHYVQRQALLKVRHPVSVNMEVTTNGFLSSPWIEVFGPKHYDDVSDIEYEQFLHSVRSHLASVPTRGLRDYSLLFEMIIEQLDERGRIHKLELADLFGVGPTAIDGWIKTLRGHITQAMA